VRGLSLAIEATPVPPHASNDDEDTSPTWLLDLLFASVATPCGTLGSAPIDYDDEALDVNFEETAKKKRPLSTAALDNGLENGVFEGSASNNDANASNTPFQAFRPIR
jgi:hypothetical protein